MIKVIEEVLDNGIVKLKERQWYVISKSDEFQSTIIQTMDGKDLLTVPYGTKVEIIVEPEVPRIRGFEPVTPEGVELTRKNFAHKGFIVPTMSIMPIQGTVGSSGYDLSTPIDIHLPVGGTVKFFTNLKAYMQLGECLIIGVRSSVGIDDAVVLAEALTFVDQDYHNNPTNEGNFGIVLRNTGQKAVHYNVGDRVCQALFIPVLRSDNCNTRQHRISGFGHTGK